MPLRSVLDAIDSQEQVTFARYRDVVMPRWHDRNVVFIGDAAHATSPQLGQGANLALVDALLLADAIAGDPSGGRAIDTALERYTHGRRQHVRHYQWMTRALTPLFQSSSRVFGWLRDVTFPLGNAFPPTRNLMIRTMAGGALGFGRKQLAMPTVK